MYEEGSLYDMLFQQQVEALQEMDGTRTNVVNQAVDPEPDLQGETEQGTPPNDEDGEDDHEEEDDSDDGVLDDDETEDEDEVKTWVM